jgi:DNA-binding CsgD family transcriptional regulator/tetratricopeptide (TPR) repeat protein
MQTRLTSSRFVGRAAELEELESALAQAAECRPALVLVGAESGVGKTRLVIELERRLEQRGLLVLRGEGVELSEGDLPYAPVIAALRPLVREHHPALDALTAGSAAQLAGLMPGLGDGGGTDERGDGSGQLRLFEALLELLDLLSDGQPVALILEDMHWVDRSTRTFVSYLARSLREERVLLILTYRSDELHRRHGLRPLLGELERLERARRIELAPFDREELTEVMRDILDGEPSEQLVSRLYMRSEGNPLYTEELLAAGLDGRGAAPQSLRDAFMLRIERLPDDAQRAVRAIAVGRSLDEQMIADVTGIGHDELSAALREAVAEQVLRAGESGGLSFRHALLREAVYDDLLPGERAELHLALAYAFEARADAEPKLDPQLAATIANHYAMAGDQPAALRATVQAALAAQEVHAYGDVADLAERGLGLWPRVPDAAQTLPLDHVELIRLAVTAHSIAGDNSRAEVLIRSALDEVDPEQERARYSDLLARLARTLWSLNRGDEAIATARRALAMLPEDEVSVERAALLAWLARTRHLRGRYREALEEGQDALASAVAAGDRHSESEVLNTLGMTTIVLGRVDEGVTLLRRALEIAREHDDLERMSTAYANLADALKLAGQAVPALKIAREGLAATPRRMMRGHDWLTLTVSDLLFEVGDWEGARTYLSPPPSKLVGLSLMFRLLREAEQTLGEGDEATADRCLAATESLVATTSEPQWIGTFGVLLAELRRRSRDLEGARAAVAQTLDRIELCTDDVSRIARVSAVGACIEADIAQRARDLREPAVERDARARARIHGQRLRAAAQEGGPVERAWKTVGTAELARARGRDDPRLWLKAAREWEAMDCPYRGALARRRAADAYIEAGERGAAAQAAGESLDVARRLGARWLIDEITALGERARLALPAEPGRPGGSAPQTPEPDPFGLTPRELQVLALIAEGATNRQIGAALFMAEKTASVHVSRILGKLGVRSRTQAAAIEHRLHLASRNPTT